VRHVRRHQDEAMTTQDIGASLHLHATIDIPEGEPERIEQITPLRELILDECSGGVEGEDARRGFRQQPVRRDGHEDKALARGRLRRDADRLPRESPVDRDRLVLPQASREAAAEEVGDTRVERGRDGGESCVATRNGLSLAHAETRIGE
jgi:hypothetical protein